jgi:hypothetical protein
MRRRYHIIEEGSALFGCGVFALENVPWLNDFGLKNWIDSRKRTEPAHFKCKVLHLTLAHLILKTVSTVSHRHPQPVRMMVNAKFLPQFLPKITKFTYLDLSLVKVHCSRLLLQRILSFEQFLYWQIC